MILKGKRSHVVIAKANVTVVCWPISELKKILIPGPLLSFPKRVKFNDSGLGALKCVCFKSSLWYWYIVCMKKIVWKNRRKMPTLGYTEYWTLQMCVHGYMCTCVSPRNDLAVLVFIILNLWPIIFECSLKHPSSQRLANFSHFLQKPGLHSWNSKGSTWLRPAAFWLDADGIQWNWVAIPCMVSGCFHQQSPSSTHATFL